MDKTSCPLLVLGTRTFAVEIADLAGEIGPYHVTGYVENMDRKRCQEPLEGLPVHWIDELSKFAGSHWVVCGLGTTERHRYVEQVSPIGLPFATLIHPTARVSRRSSVGEGAIASVNTVVAACSCLGKHVLLNRGALVGHHTSIGEYTTVGPGANIAGNCQIGQRVYVGMGAILLDHVSVGQQAVIGAGSVVTQDVPAHVQVVGVPARIVKDGICGK